MTFSNTNANIIDSEEQRKVEYRNIVLSTHQAQHRLRAVMENLDLTKCGYKGHILEARPAEFLPQRGTEQ